MIHGELIVDNFAGGGGASTGIELATGYSVDIAINHDPEAIRMHKTKPSDPVRRLQRWVNMRAVFDSVPRFEDYI